MAAAARKKALVLSLTLATFSVDKKVEEKYKYRMSDRSVFESEKEKEDDFQPAKKHRTKPSAPKGKQRSKLKCCHWKSISKGYVPKILRHSGQFQHTMDCRERNQRSAILKAKTESMNTFIKSSGSIAG